MEAGGWRGLELEQSAELVFAEEAAVHQEVAFTGQKGAVTVGTGETFEVVHHPYTATHH